MVDRMAKGQLLERSVIIPFEWHRGAPSGRPDSGCLDGIFLRGTEPPPLLVCSPHPLLGGSMLNPVVNELAYAAARCGRASLRFDYQGVGASEGEPSDDPERATADAKAALDHLLETTGQRGAAVAGYSFGCWPALLQAARDPRIDRLLLIAPPRNMLALPDYGTVSIPVTVVAGSADGLVDLAKEKELVQAQAARVRLEVLDADHSFRAAIVALARITERTLGAVRTD
jgi:alpha/beta superfamily hydrolase